MKKALIAMSGGVDSSVAAYLMKEQGYDLTGVTMKLFGNEDIGSNGKCCSLDDAEDARQVAARLDIPFYVFNFSDEFKNQVIRRFVEGYQDGLTPNPCIDCNRYLKFEKLLQRAKQMGIDYVVTGHYARIDYDKGKSRYLLKKAACDAKDQSYALYSMTQEQLGHTLFPLGELTKSEVRGIAAKQGFINADKGDSQDICFVRDKDYAGFIEEYSNKKCDEGNFVDVNGNIIGRHRGLIRYTIGQRKGLGIAFGKPMYVRSKNKRDNSVTLCGNEDLFTKSLHAADFNWIACDKVISPLRLKAKIRYNQPEQWAVVNGVANKAVIEFDEPQRAVAKGQAVVLYDGDIVVGGGTIV